MSVSEKKSIYKKKAPKKKKREVFKKEQRKSRKTHYKLVAKYHLWKEGTVSYFLSNDYLKMYNFPDNSDFLSEILNTQSQFFKL